MSYMKQKFAHAATTLFPPDSMAFFSIGAYCKVPRVKKQMPVRDVREFIRRHHSFVYDMYANVQGALVCRAIDKTITTELLCEQEVGLE